MGTKPNSDGINPFEDPVDRILAEIALSLQLPPSLHDQVRDRYEAVRRHLEATTVFKDLIEYFYPQGSMAIDATIAIRGTDDEYDLDIVTQLGGRFRFMGPLPILIELENALQDYPVQAVKRQTRCVTLFYADRMHLDITPALRAQKEIERESFITHAKGPAPSADDRFVDMNAYGFAGWYRQRTPTERRVARAFDERLRGCRSVVADAEVDDVPDQTHFVVKNIATLALQLLKRDRNIRYAHYNGRIPPSVMLSYYAGLAAQPNMRLSDMLIRIATWIIRDIAQASLHRQRLHVANPLCPRDVFTDRWPESLEQQNDYANHLKDLVQGLEGIRSQTMSADAIRDWLRNRFGERVVTKATDRMAREIGDAIQNSEQQYLRKGGVFVPNRALAVGAAAAPLLNTGVAARPHTFYGMRI